MRPAPQTSAGAAVVVATSCPCCGAPLEVGETANATECGHCRSRLVVTGYGRTLSYQIAPRVAAGEARALVRFAQPSDGTHRRIGDPRLLLFPYHRLTGLELRWTRPPAAAEEEARRAAARREVAALTTLLPARPRPTGPPVFAGRWVERTVGACADDGLVPYSLGVRPSVLRLELFRPEALGATAVVAPALAADAALGLGAAPQPDTLHLNLIDRRLAVVYFPFWLVDVRTAAAHRTAVVDGTAGTIVTTDVDPDRIARLAPAAAGSAPILGFRPLACPNCGWDLPADPRQAVFHCGACHRAWRLGSERLEPMRYRIVLPPAGDGGRYELLPVWITERAGAAAHPRLFAPAFRFRQLRRLVDLGRNLTRVNPALAFADGEAPDGGHGLGHCYLGRADGAALARFVLAGLPPHGVPRAAPATVAAGEPTLTWLPFRVGPYALHEPRTGTSLPKRLLS